MAKKDNKIVARRAQSTDTLAITQGDVNSLFVRCLNSVRPDLRDNTYILEGLRVLEVGGYRSAIGSFWNAVVDDLRNKIIARSLKLFNKSVHCEREIKTYEDFQDYVNDDQLIEGAYAIGVIGWEASRVLKHAKETRHIFDGHPKSSEPSPLKVLAMMDDCVKYVLKAEYPSPIIDIDEYMIVLSDQQFDRNQIAIENAIGELPETYKTELANRLYSAYVHPDSTTILRSNIEFVAPILWKVLPKSLKIQIARRVDQEITKGVTTSSNQAFAFMRIVSTGPYLSAFAKRYKIKPLIQKLKDNLDKWKIENEAVDELQPYASVIPPEDLQDYVDAITHTYVGYTGYSFEFSRTDFYADTAASLIPGMFQAFDDRAAEAFVNCVKGSRILRERLGDPAKMRRLRSLGNIVLERVSKDFSGRTFLETLVNETKESAFIKIITSKK